MKPFADRPRLELLGIALLAAATTSVSACGSSSAKQKQDSAASRPASTATTKATHLTPPAQAAGNCLRQAGYRVPATGRDAVVLVEAASGRRLARLHVYATASRARRAARHATRHGQIVADFTKAATPSNRFGITNCLPG